MPLNVVDTEGVKIPPERWTSEQRQKWIREVLSEQRDNRHANRPIGEAALTEAAEIAEGDPVMVQEVADARITLGAVKGGK